ncbi:hypothetical protein NUACC21_66970 [Scytonema sp. NUACC21]
MVEATANLSKRKVAVVAVHGVSDQQPYDSARAIACLLLALNQNKGNKTQYTPFYEKLVNIAVSPVKIDGSTKQKLTSEKKFFLDERGPFIQKGLKLASKETKDLEGYALDELDDYSHGFISDQLREYEVRNQDAVYETVRLESTCFGQGHQTDVHVYEMYWADLSRLGTGFLRIFGEFYQLLFHLGSLGRHNIDFARLEYQRTHNLENVPWWHRDRLNWFMWQTYSWLFVWAQRMLALFIPILNLYLLLAVLISIPGNIPIQYQPFIVAISIVVSIAVFIGWFLWQKPEENSENTSAINWRSWARTTPILTIVTLLAVILYGWLKGPFHLLPQSISYRFLAFEWSVLLAIPIAYLINRYGCRSPGAVKIALILGIPLAVLTTIFLIIAPDSHEGITQASFRVVELIFIGLVLSWFVFNSFYFLLILLGQLVVRGIQQKEQKEQEQQKQQEQQEQQERAQRAIWFSRLSLGIPSALFFIVTTSFWTVLDRVSSSLLPQTNFYTPIIPWLNPKQVPISGHDFLDKLIVFSASPFFILVLFLILGVVLVAVWSLLPLVWTEVQPPKSNDKVLSRKLGQWLTNGFKLMSWSIDLLIVLAMGFVFPAGCVCAILYPEVNSELTKAILEILGTFLAASATSLIALRGRLDKLALGFRSLLDVLLDVDSYLRQRPFDDNPSARIYSRYVSLLRYLCKWSDPQDGKGYDSIVFVAHSQGTIITADLLRFLKRKPESDPELSPLFSATPTIPMYFFTMGCPLRQLYSVAFPHLYEWARHNDMTQWEWENPLHIDENQKPNPKDLGVKLWVNAFYSGDYIGRYLWRSDLCSYQWSRKCVDPTYVSEDESGMRREFCLGAGAHTRYWEPTENEVAEQIDSLIGKASNVS